MDYLCVICFLHLLWFVCYLVLRHVEADHTGSQRHITICKVGEGDGDVAGDLVNETESKRDCAGVVRAALKRTEAIV